MSYRKSDTNCTVRLVSLHSLSKDKLAQCEASAKSYRQQRDILHKTSLQAVRFCQEQQVEVLAVGDVRDISDSIAMGRHANQKISQWTHGLLVEYLKYKLARVGVAVWQIPEDYSTKACSKCSHLNTKAPKGRHFTCTGCGASMHRDIDGAANITSRAKYSYYGKVQVSTKPTYLRPLAKPSAKPEKVVEAMIQPTRKGEANVS
jgi:IS605 OrfB family transposase